MSNNAHQKNHVCGRFEVRGLIDHRKYKHLCVRKSEIEISPSLSPLIVQKWEIDRYHGKCIMKSIRSFFVIYWKQSLFTVISFSHESRLIRNRYLKISRRNWVGETRPKGLSDYIQRVSSMKTTELVFSSEFKVKTW